jgi:prepilin-type N-terminal cleavage/methylation domain-containing protein
MALQPSLRRGMTLIELLVVVAIMLTLVITIAPNVVNSAEARRGREAARMVSGFVANAQSRALGRAEWSGLMILATNTTSFAAIDMVLADVPPAYRGDTWDATVTVTDIDVGMSRNASPQPTDALNSLTTAGVIEGDVIRFDGRGPLFELKDPKSSGFEFKYQGSVGKAEDDLGYVPHNTPWPALSPVRHTFEIFRKPAPAGSPLSLPENRAVDLFWSGVGPPQVDDVTGTYQQFFKPTENPTTREITTRPVAPVSLVFDGTGRMRQAIVGSTRLIITGPVFLLVGRADRFITNLKNDKDPNRPENIVATDDSTGANWQYPDSHWVAIDPMTGVAKTAECFPGAASVTDSQRLVRDALLASGR